MSKYSDVEDIDAIMEEMEAKTPKPGDINKSFDEFDAKRQKEEDVKILEMPTDKLDAKSLWSSLTFTKKEPEAPGKTIPSKPTNERYYDFTNANVGVAMIFNQMKVKGEMERKGSKKDANDLEIVLLKIGFDVKVYDDFTVDQIRNELFASEYKLQNFHRDTSSFNENALSSFQCQSATILITIVCS